MLSVLHLTGEAALSTADIQLAGSNLATDKIRGDNSTAWASHLAKPMALSSSLLSLEDIATALQAKASHRFASNRYAPWKRGTKRITFASRGWL